MSTSSWLAPMYEMERDWTNPYRCSQKNLKLINLPAHSCMNKAKRPDCTTAYTCSGPESISCGFAMM